MLFILYTDIKRTHYYMTSREVAAIGWDGFLAIHYLPWKKQTESSNKSGFFFFFVRRNVHRALNNMNFDS